MRVVVTMRTLTQEVIPKISAPVVEEHSCDEYTAPDILADGTIAMVCARCRKLYPMEDRYGGKMRLVVS